MVVEVTTPAEALWTLRQESLRLLRDYAIQIHNVASHSWKNPAIKDRVVQLVNCAKRDLGESHKTLNDIVQRHDKSNGRKGADIYHADLLQAGGEYMSFIDDVNNCIQPAVEELSNLMDEEVAYLESKKEEV